MSEEKEVLFDKAYEIIMAVYFTHPGMSSINQPVTAQKVKKDAENWMKAYRKVCIQ